MKFLGTLSNEKKIVLISFIIIIFVVFSFSKVNLVNHYKRSDGSYEFDYPNSFKITRDIQGTQILFPIKHLNDSNFNPDVSIYSKPSFGLSLEDSIKGLDRQDLQKLKVNNLNAISYRQITDLYEDDYYAVEKGETIVVVQFRKWTKFNNVYQDISEFSNDVFGIFNSLIIH